MEKKNTHKENKAFISFFFCLGLLSQSLEVYKLKDMADDLLL